MRSRGVDSLLLDLRNVVDPDVRAAATLAGMFVDGAAIRLRDRQGEVTESVESTGTGDAWPGGISVLVNGATAGASEALTRILQAGREIRVYGESTFGLGSEPRLFELPDGAGILISAARWESTAGQTWNGEGIEPDRTVSSPGVGVEFEEALERQLEATIDALQADAPAAGDRRAA